jgi:hypothetical protein
MRYRAWMGNEGGRMKESPPQAVVVPSLTQFTHNSYEILLNINIIQNIERKKEKKKKKIKSKKRCCLEFSNLRP